jgi:hypothetical protein
LERVRRLLAESESVDQVNPCMEQNAFGSRVLIWEVASGGASRARRQGKCGPAGQQGSFSSLEGLERRSFGGGAGHLREGNASVDAQDNMGRTPLEMASFGHARDPNNPNIIHADNSNPLT